MKCKKEVRHIYVLELTKEERDLVVQAILDVNSGLDRPNHVDDFLAKLRVALIEA